MQIIYLVIAMIATTLGALSGLGGGVIIKPGIDALGTLSVATASFLSTCTVLSMTISSFIRNRNSKIKLNYKMSGFLATGAITGGYIGKKIFSNLSGNIGFLQSLVLLIVIIAIVIYISNKSKIKSLDIKNPVAALFIGLSLGCIAAFLGIGGGPLNVAVLYFFFSMNGKEAAKNSLFIIFFSQTSSIVTTILTNNVPEFEILTLILMCFGGVSGALIGSAISKKVDSKTVEKIFMFVMIALILLNAFNVYKFAVI